jgi:aspartate carbamoyltransferase regulatory subunit
MDDQRQLTKKELFTMDFKSVFKPDYLVMAIMLPNGAIEIITNTQRLEEKFQYYLKNYNDDMVMTKNEEIAILNWMVV